MLEIGAVLSESVERDAIELVPVDVETTELETDVLCHEELVEQVLVKHDAIDSPAVRLGHRFSVYRNAPSRRPHKPAHLTPLSTHLTRHLGIFSA